MAVMAWMVAQETSRSSLGLFFFSGFLPASDTSLFLLGFFFFWAVSLSFLGSISSSLGLFLTSLTRFLALILVSSPRWSINFDPLTSFTSNPSGSQGDLSEVFCCWMRTSSPLVSFFSLAFCLLSKVSFCCLFFSSCLALASSSLSEPFFFGRFCGSLVFIFRPNIIS